MTTPWEEIHHVIYTTGDTRILTKPNPDVGSDEALVIEQQTWDSEKKDWKVESTIYISKEEALLMARNLLKRFHA